MSVVKNFYQLTKIYVDQLFYYYILYVWNQNNIYYTSYIWTYSANSVIYMRNQKRNFSVFYKPYTCSVPIPYIIYRIKKRTFSVSYKFRTYSAPYVRDQKKRTISVFYKFRTNSVPVPYFDLHLDSYKFSKTA